MQIKWHEDAISDLVALRHHIAPDDSQAAQRIAAKILGRIKSLKVHPLLGKVGRIHSTREIVVIGTPYTVIYLPLSDTITILRVFHQAQMW